MSCGVGHRGGSDPSLLWLWHRPAATTPIQSLASELPYVIGLALKSKKKKKKKSGIPLLAQWVKDQIKGSDIIAAVAWVAAVTWFQSLTQEFPHAGSMAKQNEKK